MNRNIQTEIIINAPKEKVWAILMSTESYSEWNPFIITIEGVPAIGRPIKNTLMNGKSKMVFSPIVQELIPNQRFSWKGNLIVKGLFDGYHYFEIEELSHNQVKLVHGEQFSGLLSGYLLKKIGDSTRLGFIQMNQALKSRAEANIQ